MRLRFAPSPTGFLHLGGLRTALFNYLWARKNGGKIFLRIEDTDTSRTVKGAVDSIIDTLKWAKISFDCDYGAFVQSKRLDIYKKYARHLLDLRRAYYCQCPPSMDKVEFGQSHKSTRECCCGNRIYDSGAIKFQRSSDQFSYDDLVYGQIPPNADAQKQDPIIIKSDGFPTYHFANVIDDHLMETTLVMRGQEWIPSTLLHLDLYKSFDWQPPQFAHLPLLIRPDGSKLSKRHQDAFVSYYRDDLGMLPEALNNFVAFLGWNPKTTTREIFGMNELIDAFDIKGINRGAACVDVKKLLWTNGKHLNSKDGINQLMDKTGSDYEYCKKVIEVMNCRVQTTSQLINEAWYFFKSPLVEGEYVQASFMKKFLDFLDVNGLEPIEKKQLRILLTGTNVGPPLLEIIKVLGPNEVKRRLSLIKYCTT